MYVCVRLVIIIIFDIYILEFGGGLLWGTTYIISWSNASGNGDSDFALVVDQPGYGPLATAVTVLVDLEPAVFRRSASGAGNLGHVGHDWPIVRGINDHAGVEVDVQSVSPLESDLGPSGNSGYLAGDDHQRVGTAVAGHIA